ncbi:MAG: DUF6442 family protein [Bulleidia sp.]|nr:DUF6442 family protein [Bulleidia sp.]
MDKEEILKNARQQEGPDEREQQIVLKSYDAAFTAELIVCCGLMIFKYIIGEPALDLFLVIEGQQAVRSFYIYSRDHEKRKYLYLGMVLTAVCIFNLIVYLKAVF